MSGRFDKPELDPVASPALAAEKAAREAADAALLEDFFDDGAQHILNVYNVEEFVEALASLADPAPYLPGTWILKLEEGIYKPTAAAGQTLSSPPGLGSRNRIKIMGPDVGAHPNVPAAVIDASAVPWGLRIGVRNYAWVKDVKVIETDRVNSAGAASFVSLTSADVWWQNCHSHAKDAYIGLLAQGSSRCFQDGGIIDGTHIYGTQIYNTTLATIGYNAKSVEQAPIIKGASLANLALRRSYADIFYTTLTEGGRGCLLDVQARGRFRSCVITDNSVVGIDNRGGSQTNLTSLTDPAKVNTLENNGPDGNGPDLAQPGYSVEFLTDIKSSAVGDLCYYRSVDPYLHTGTTAATNLSAPDNFGFKPPWFLGQGARFRIRGVGSLAGLAGGKTLGFRMNTSVLTACKTPLGGTLLVPSDTADPRAGFFVFGAEALFTNDGRVHSWSTLKVNGQPPIVDYQNKELALTGAETLRLYGQLDNAADSVEVNSWEMWMSPPKNPVILEEPDLEEEE